MAVIRNNSMDIVAENGRSYRITVMMDESGKIKDNTLVEIWQRFPADDKGMFVSRYYLDTLTEHSGDFDGLDSVTFRFVRDWLYFLVDRESVRV